MAKINADEAALIADDLRRLDQAKKARARKGASAADRQIAEQLDRVAGVEDLDDPKRYHGS